MNCLDPDSNYALFMEITRLHYLNTRIAFQKLGVYPGQPRLLFNLYKSDGVSQTELAKSLKMAPPTVNVMLKRMEKAGMIKKEQDKNDQRVTHVYITDYGRKICDGVYNETMAIDDIMFGEFSDEESDALNGFLMNIRDNLKDSMDSLR